MKLKKLFISDFRHMKDVDINFGDYLTVISGLNGTGKSSVLGLAGHLFSFRETTGTKFIYKTIIGKPFETEYSEIFKFCSNSDVGKDYYYSALIEDGDEKIYKNAIS